MDITIILYMYEYKTWMLARKLIHTLKLTNQWKWKEWPYHKVNIVIE
jgi:hypothetical protein